MVYHQYFKCKSFYCYKLYYQEVDNGFCCDEHEEGNPQLIDIGETTPAYFCFDSDQCVKYLKDML